VRQTIRQIVIIVMLLTIPACGGAAVPRTTPQVKRILIVSIDGLRPDVALRADMPNLRALANAGCFSYSALTIDPPLTLPAHTSMLTGCLPSKHAVWTDLDRPDEPVVHPKVPTLFELAKKAGYTTAIATGKAKFEALLTPDALDWSYVPKVYAQDFQVAQQAAEMIKLHRPHLLFVQLAGVDAAGHGSGWGSDDQLLAAHDADAALGLLLAELRHANLIDETAVFAVSDHGGTGYAHWYPDDRSAHVVWVLSGPRIKKNLDLTRYPELTVHVYDTFATACYLLKIPPPADVDAKPVLQVIDREEVRDAGAPAK